VLSNIESEVSNLSQNFLNFIEETRNGLKNSIEGYYDSQTETDSLSILKSDIQNELNEISSAVSGISENLTNQLSTIQSENMSKRDQIINDCETNISTKLNELNESNSDFILDTFDQVGIQMANLQGEITGSLDHAKSNIDNTVINTIETVRSDILNPVNDIVSAVESENKEITGNLTSISTEFKEIESKLTELISSSSESFNSEIITQISTQLDTWKQQLTELNSTHKSKSNENHSLFKQNMNEVTNVGKSSISSELQSIPSVIEETLDQAAGSMSLLNELSSGAIKLEPNTIDLSYFDSSKEAIIANLNGLLSRTKSNVTIVAPTITWLDKKLIPSFARATVRIIVDPDLITKDDEAIINAFKEAGVSVSLRKLDRNRYRRDIDMIMATRDREEVILAKKLDEKVPYAFVSQDEYFIEKFAELFGIFQTMPEL
ncbi:MAG: hypothetical protein OEZ01_05780, partial [Candidatus Heimdallarchaeota archaeon]|nr:hypothetical protein [Candidatus Heimdallarchaeota archaeon]